MSIDNVVDFITYKERLKDAEAAMVLANYDYEDNAGSNDAEWFWQNFEEKRNAYRAVRDEVKEDGPVD
jgi:hypothetical protein